ncbi:MAG: DUF3298 domain-containing protein [Firmicutes bacterium]|nr:DUF3298 domain-containing protein [Bacillota bacterium]
MKRYIGIILCAVVIMTSGCTQEKNKNNDKNDVTEITSEEIADKISDVTSEEVTEEVGEDEYGFKNRKVTIKESTGYLVSEDDTPILYTFLTYPYIENPDDLTGINELNLMYSMMDKQVADSYANTDLAYEANDRYKKDGDKFVPFTAQCSVSVTFNKGNVISLMVEREEFTVGSEGNYSRRGDTRYLDNNDNVGVTDIFGMTEEEITKRAADGLKKMIEKEPDKYYNNAADKAEEVIGDCIKNKGWYVKDEGVAFAVDPAVIAPYSTGCVEYVLGFVGDSEEFCKKR